MRPIWSGTITFGLVTIPVKLYSAVESQSEVSFRLLDRETLTPIKEQRINPQTGEEVPWEQVVRGVEHAKGRYVPITSEELKALPLPSAHTIELLGFTQAEEIPAVALDRTYYLGPGKGGDKAYALLAKALEEKGRVGVGKVVIRTREQLVAVQPQDGALTMRTLYYADEVRAPEEVPDLPQQVRVLPAERKMAEQLIDSMRIEFDHAAFKSEYTQALRKLIKAKLAGKELPTPREPAKVIDLQEALRASLERARAGGKATRRRRAG